MRRGITLIEVMVALSIFAVSAVSVLSCFPILMKVGKDTTMATQALYFAQQSMDSVLRTQVNPGDPTPDTPAGLSEQHLDQPVTWVGMTRTLTSTPSVLDPINLVDISVTVDWVENGRNRTVRLVTTIKPGERQLMRRRGFTLTELVVMMAILSILSTALYAVITLALTYYRNSLDRITAENNARTAISVLTSEFRQAAHWGVESTSVILPAVTNDLTHPSHELEFQELVPNISLATLPPGAIDQDPSQFELIHYYLSPALAPTLLLRTVAAYDVNGNALPPGPPSVITRSVNGGIDVSTVFWTSNSVTMVVTAQEGGYTDANQVYHPAVQDTITCNEVSASYH